MNLYELFWLQAVLLQQLLDEYINASPAKSLLGKEVSILDASDMAQVKRDYVRAAQAIGASAASRMFRHILPNISHVILVQLSILVVGFIKAEVILSYLGLGVRVDQVSWGTMLAEAQSELLLGRWWQLAAATLFMATFVTAFSLLTDALRDALDPKLRGLE